MPPLCISRNGAAEPIPEMIHAAGGVNHLTGNSAWPILPRLGANDLLDSPWNQFFVARLPQDLKNEEEQGSHHPRRRQGEQHGPHLWTNAY